MTKRSFWGKMRHEIKANSFWKKAHWKKTLFCLFSIISLFSSKYINRTELKKQFQMLNILLGGLYSFFTVQTKDLLTDSSKNAWIALNISLYVFQAFFDTSLSLNTCSHLENINSIVCRSSRGRRNLSSQRSQRAMLRKNAFSAKVQELWIFNPEDIPYNIFHSHNVILQNKSFFFSDFHATTSCSKNLKFIYPWAHSIGPKLK